MCLHKAIILPSVTVVCQLTNDKPGLRPNYGENQLVPVLTVLLYY